MRQNLMLFAVLTLTTTPGNLPAQGRADHVSPGQQETVMQMRPTGPETGPAGHWEGIFKVNDREIGLALDLAKNAKSEWIASMSVPAENATGLVVTDVVVSGDSVKFVGVELMMARFDLTLGPDGRMGGDHLQPAKYIANRIQTYRPTESGTGPGQPGGVERLRGRLGGLAPNARAHVPDPLPFQESGGRDGRGHCGHSGQWGHRPAAEQCETDWPESGGGDENCPRHFSRNAKPRGHGVGGSVCP